MKATRYLSSAILAAALVLSGRLRSARQHVSENGYILSFCAHNPNRALFEKVIKWFLKRGYRFISSEELLDLLQNQKATKDLVWLSFDDGWKGNVFNVVPVLNEYNIPATFFVSTGQIEKGYFWFEFAKRNRDRFPNSISSLWKISNAERLSQLDAVESKIDRRIAKHTLSTSDIQQLSTNPLITFGNHTDGHAICVNCTEKELSIEIDECNRKLKDLTNETASLFAYPNGDYDSRVVDVVRKSGMVLAATIEPRSISLDDDLLRIPRAPMLDDGSFWENLLHIFGVWQPVIRRLKQHAPV